MCIGFSDTIHIIELKKPMHKINQEDLDQIRDYVVYFQTIIGTDPSYSYTSVSGYLICGDVSSSPMVRKYISMNENNRIYVRKYHELLASAQRLHRDFIDKLVNTKNTPK